jgi:hypothetical protein
MAKQIEVGDRVRLTSKFLKNTGQQRGSEGVSRWTVLALSDSFAVVDQKTGTGKSGYEDLSDEEFFALKLDYRRINVGNLERVK